MSDLRSEDPKVKYFQKRLDATFQDLDYLLHCKKSAEKEGVELDFEVRLLAYAPSFGLSGFNTGQSTGLMVVEIYPHATGWGNEPCFDLNAQRDGVWYGYFVEQFEAMWQRAKPWNPPLT